LAIKLSIQLNYYSGATATLYKKPSEALGFPSPAPLSKDFSDAQWDFGLATGNVNPSTLKPFKAVHSKRLAISRLA
jgi:hypothetical protein